MYITVEKPGVHSTIQDLGRPNRRRDGIPGGGAADPLAMRVANWLVGNDESAAGVECSLVGPTLHFNRSTVVAICGAEAAGLPHWQAFEVRPCQPIRLGRLHHGVYAYLAVAGGIGVPVRLGSRSTDTRLRIGGLQGRPLGRGDVLPVLPAPHRSECLSARRVHFEPWYSPPTVLRIVPGEHFDALPAGDRPFEVSAKSDRMGIRLRGPTLRTTNIAEGQSGLVLPGTIQVPPDGQPIILLADAQTIGGYPKFGYVVDADLPKAAQLQPGESVRFVAVTLEEAHALSRQRAKELAFLKTGLDLRY